MALCFLFKQNISVYFCFMFGISISYLFTLYSELNSECLSLDFYLAKTVNYGKNEDYEPRINLAGKPQKAKKVPQNLKRPRYYSSELGIREKLFVGILTNEKTVGSLAIAINKTTSHLVNKLMFFMDAVGAEKANIMSLKLPGVVGFVDTRELLKPFHMLKYLTDNFLEEYDFFFLSKDTSYINAKLLSNIVKKLSVSLEVHVGGILKQDTSFCSLDGGILLSNSILKKIQSSLDWCVKNAFSDLDDDNVGRCILHASQISCVSNIQNMELKSVTLSDSQKDDIEGRYLETAVTYHPMSDQNIFYRLHLILMKRALEIQKGMIADLKKTLDIHELAWPPGTYPPKKPSNRFDLLSWQHFDLKNIYLTSDFVNIKPLEGAELIDIHNIKNRSVRWLIEKYEGNIQFKRLVNGYKRFDPSRGLDYILDLAFREVSGKETIKRVEVSKPLGRVEMLSMPYVTENTRLFLLTPILDSEKSMAADFMKQYAQTCSQADPSILILVFLYEPKAPGKGHVADVFKEVKELALGLSATHHRDCKITWISIRVPEVEGEVPLQDHLLHFAIMDLASKRLPPDALVLLTEPNMELRSDYLNRVRMSTIAGKQIYSPIPFTEFRPDIVYRNSERKPNLEVHKNTGRFDTENVRHISFYLSDYLAVRKDLSYLYPVKADKDIVHLLAGARSRGEAGVGSLLDALCRTGLSLIRPAEPSLRLRRPACRPSPVSRASRRSTQFDKCDAPLATRAQLGQLILDLISSKTTTRQL